MIVLCLLYYTIPLDSPLMDYIEYLQIRGFIDMTIERPYELEWITAQLDNIIVHDNELNTLDRKIVSMFSSVLTKNEDYSYLMHFNTAYVNKPEYYYAFLDFRQGGILAHKMRFTQAIRFQRASEIDSFGPRPWKDFQAYLNEGLVRWTMDDMRCGIGRRNFVLGHGSDHSLLLSADPQGYDGFYVSVPVRYLNFFTFFSVLDPELQRYISIHRLGIDLRRFLQIGFSEAVLFGNSLEPLYLNPFFPYYLSQWGTDRNDNIMWQLDIQMRLFNSIIYGELLIDDYMYEDNPYPDKLAFQCGFRTTMLNTILAKVNYTFVDKWVYSQRYLINTYEKNGRCLGFPLGNDADRFSCILKYFGAFTAVPHISFHYTRKGEGSIFLPYEEEGGNWTPPFPSGIVERTIDIGIGIDYTFRSMFTLKADAGIRYIYNLGHIDENNTDDAYFAVSLWGIL